MAVLGKKPTGSGKTTTMAALLEEINRNKYANVFTIEEPIEYVFKDKKSVIHQREVGRDTQSFATALHSVTRQSPDVIAIGELRDRETMEVAMTAAEIGHLVITTLHTTSAAATVDRIVNSFPEHLKSADLSAVERVAAVCDVAATGAAGAGRGRSSPAVEVMTSSPTVKKQLEEGDATDLYASIRDGGHFGMNTINQALENLVCGETITYEEAIQFAGNRRDCAKFSQENEDETKDSQKTQTVPLSRALKCVLVPHLRNFVRHFVWQPVDRRLRKVGDPAIPLAHVAVDPGQCLPASGSFLGFSFDIPSGSGLFVVKRGLALRAFAYFQG